MMKDITNKDFIVGKIPEFILALDKLQGVISPASVDSGILLAKI